MEWTVIVMMLALVQYIVQGAQVGMARGRTGVEAPAVSGNPEFERYFRVHQNTLEQLVIFLPAVWFFGVYAHALGAAGLGVVYLVGRMLYAINYVKDPASRGVGMMLTVLPSYLLVLGALGGAIWSLVG